METKKKITLNFYGFWEGFDFHDFFIYQLLSTKYDVSIADDPEYAIISCFDYEYKFLSQCKGVRIYYTGENVPPDFAIYDYAIGFDHISFGDRYFRYPMSYNDFDAGSLAAQKHKCDESILAEKDLFCTFMYSHEGCKERTELFHKVSGYKKVESVGKYLHNSDIQIPYDKDNSSKFRFQKRAKFVMAIENISYPGYATEKILHAFASQSVPIYYGDPRIAEEFNPEAFVNCHDFSSFDQVVEFVRELDNDNDLYMRMLQAPAFREEGYVEKKKREFEEFLCAIIEQPYSNAFRRPTDGIQIDRSNELSKHAFYKREYLLLKSRGLMNRVKHKLSQLQGGNKHD